MHSKNCYVLIWGINITADIQSHDSNGCTLSMRNFLKMIFYPLEEKRPFRIFFLLLKFFQREFKVTVAGFNRPLQNFYIKKNFFDEKWKSRCKLIWARIYSAKFKNIFISQWLLSFKSRKKNYHEESQRRSTGDDFPRSWGGSFRDQIKFTSPRIMK